MRSEKTVLDVLFPRVRAELLRLLFIEPPEQRYVRELMNMSGLALHTVQDELRKLSMVGLIVTWSNGYHLFYRANRDHPLFGALLHIVEVSAKLPRAKQSTLRRPQSRQPVKKQTERQIRSLAKDWPGKGIFFRISPELDGFEPSSRLAGFLYSTSLG